VRDRRSHPWAALGERRRPRPAAARRLEGRCAAPLRAAPAAPRPRRRARAHEGVSLNIIQRQLGHTNLGVTSIYLQGIDNSEIVATVHARKAPTIPASTGLRV
jgi:integrase